MSYFIQIIFLILKKTYLRYLCNALDKQQKINSIFFTIILGVFFLLKYWFNLIIIWDEIYVGTSVCMYAHMYVKTYNQLL